MGANYGPVVSANLQVLRKILEQQRSNAAAERASKRVRNGRNISVIIDDTVFSKNSVACM